MIPTRNEFADFWLLDPQIVYLNHGSLGACPRTVLDAQTAFREQMERQPIDFMDRRTEPLLDAARTALARVVGADTEDLVFVANATAGVNTVLRSLTFEPGDELLVTDHTYGACRHAAEYVARRAGAKVVVARMPFPLADADEAVAAILAAVTPRTRLAVLDHITSPTALLLPIERLVAELDRRGVDSLVDGAHAPGQAPLDLRALGAAYYTGNGHKWLCSPKGSAFLHVRRDRRDAVHPLSISHGYAANDPARGRLWLEFDWTGTADFTPWMCFPAAIEFLEALFPGGLGGLMARNHDLARRARDILCDALSVPPPCPDAMLGAMAAVALPDGEPGRGATYRHFDPLQTRLLAEHGIEVPIIAWPDEPRRWVRVSAQAYNHEAQYAYLADALRESFAV